jgi:Tol biopolymer transport system component
MGRARAWPITITGLIMALALMLPAAPALAKRLPITQPDAEDGLIAFHRVFFGPDGSAVKIAIFTIKPDGTEPRQVTDPPNGVETGRVDWSPDGQWLAYMRTSLEIWRPHIVVVRTDGSERTDLTRDHCPPRSCQGEEDPAWSPSGRRIAFIRLLRGTPSLFVMRSDGTHRRQLFGPPQDRYIDWAPAWSPDGKRLVFRRWDDRREVAALFTVRLNSGKLRRITPWTLDFLNRPDWSADGRWILFQKPADDETTQLYLIHPNETGLTKVTDVPDVGWLWASFSPDGTRITAVRVPGEASENDVYVMNIDGSGIAPLTASLSLDAAEGLPDWGYVSETTSPVSRLPISPVNPPH